MAAYELFTSGYNNVGVLKGGFSDWTKSGRCKCRTTCCLHCSAAATIV